MDELTRRHYNALAQYRFSGQFGAGWVYRDAINDNFIAFFVGEGLIENSGDHINHRITEKGHWWLTRLEMQERIDGAIWALTRQVDERDIVKGLDGKIILALMMLNHEVELTDDGMIKPVPQLKPISSPEDKQP